MNMSLEELGRIAFEYKSRMDGFKKVILICTGTGCVSSGAMKVFDALKKAVEKEGLKDKILIKKTGCHGLC